MPQVHVNPNGAYALSPFAPPSLPDLEGCVSSVRHALLGAGEDPSRLLEAGELRTSTETAMLRLDHDLLAEQRWGVFWAQLACPSLPEDWPLGSSVQEWGEVDGTSTWLLAAGAGEGDEHIELNLPPSQRAVWRPLGLVRAPIVEIYLRDPGCALQFLYKGTIHPSEAPRCISDLESEDVVPLLRPPIRSWYTPPDAGGSRFTSSATVRWLTSFAFSSRGAYAMLISSDAPRSTGGYGTGAYGGNGQWSSGEPGAWHVADGLLTTASECLHGRCAPQLAACYKEAKCQHAWSDFIANQGKVPWNQTAMDSWQQAGRAAKFPASQTAFRGLLSCFTSTCTCQARDRTPAVRFTGREGLDAADIARVLDLAARVGGATRRAFGLSEGGLSSPTTHRGAATPPKVAQGHGVTYLHGVFASELPTLHAKLVASALRAHDESGWGVIDAPRLTVRTIELLDYEHASDSLGWHVDEQSAITMLVRERP